MDGLRTFGRFDSVEGKGGSGMATGGYNHPALWQLKEQQSRFAPKEKRLEQIDRAELLLAEIEDARSYPYEYVCFRITGFRPEGMPALLLEGKDVRHDLRLFVEELSATVGQKAEHRRGEQAVQRLDSDGHPMASARSGGSAVHH